MTLGQTIGAELPYLRRYARAITGSQEIGDAAVRHVLEALVQAPGEFDRGRPPRFELFRLFHAKAPGGTAGAPSGEAGQGPVAALPLRARQALLLSMVEGFPTAETATILGCPAGEVDELVDEARTVLAQGLHARVMIIEDETIIAMHLQSIVESLGYEVAGVARTHREAVQLAGRTHPDLILADISLADGSSGMEAVAEILGRQCLPVIFITAFPERLLTGERPEPTYLITKPFEPETVTATMWQALLVHRENGHGLATAA